MPARAITALVAVEEDAVFRQGVVPEVGGVEAWDKGGGPGQFFPSPLTRD